GERPGVRGCFLLGFRAWAVSPGGPTPPAPRRGRQVVARTFQGRLHAFVAVRPGRAPRRGSATRFRGDDARARPPPHDVCERLPEMPTALLVQPPPRAGRGAALGGDGARRLPA